MTPMYIMFEHAKPFPKMGEGRVKSLTNNIMMRWAKQKEPSLYNLYMFYLNQIKLKYGTQAKNKAMMMNNSGKYISDVKDKLKTWGKNI